MLIIGRLSDNDPKDIWFLVSRLIPCPNNANGRFDDFKVSSKFIVSDLVSDGDTNESLLYLIELLGINSASNMSTGIVI